MIKAVLISALALGLTACVQEAAESSSEAPAEVITGEVVASGVFEGASDHVTTGGVTIRKSADGYYVTLEDDFSLDGAPDPKLGFGNPDYIVETQFSALKSKTGYQSYKLPEGFDPAGYQTIYVWCEQFSVPLGVATLG